MTNHDVTAHRPLLSHSWTLPVDNLFHHPRVYLVELTQHREMTVSLIKRELKDLIAIYCVTRVLNDVLLPERIKLLKRMISPVNAMQNIFSYKFMTITSR